MQQQVDGDYHEDAEDKNTTSGIYYKQQQTTDGVYIGLEVGDSCFLLGLSGCLILAAIIRPLRDGLRCYGFSCHSFQVNVTNDQDS